MVRAHAPARHEYPSCKLTLPGSTCLAVAAYVYATRLGAWLLARAITAMLPSLACVPATAPVRTEWHARACTNSKQLPAPDVRGTATATAEPFTNVHGNYDG